MNFTPSFHDIAHLAHLELLTPKPEESLSFFTNIVGLHESGRANNSVYLRAWGDFERSTLKLTAAKTSGIGRVAFRARSAEVLAQLAEHLGANGVKGNWIDGDIGHGPAFRVSDPDGHAIEIYYETERYLRLLGADNKDNQDMRRKASPITYVHEGEPPLLFVHGTDDKPVPYEQGELFADAMEGAVLYERRDAPLDHRSRSRRLRPSRDRPSFACVLHRGSSAGQETG
jgi:catechol 2,3-dioxygenase-like lactoylglutathione lyase family enzyme